MEDLFKGQTTRGILKILFWGIVPFAFLLYLYVDYTWKNQIPWVIDPFVLLGVYGLVLVICVFSNLAKKRFKYAFTFLIVIITWVLFLFHSYFF